MKSWGNAVVLIDGSIFIAAAMLLLILPLDWILAILVGAVFHEACHILAVLLMGGKISSIRIGFRGTKINAYLLNCFFECLAVAAGPIGSVSLVAFRRVFPKIAVTGFIQGIFNLLPYEHLDGGRLASVILMNLLPRYGTIVINVMQLLASILLIYFLLWEHSSMRIGMTIILLIQTVRSLKRKIPCKRRKIGLQ